MLALVPSGVVLPGIHDDDDWLPFLRPMPPLVATNARDVSISRSASPITTMQPKDKLISPGNARAGVRVTSFRVANLIPVRAVAIGRVNEAHASRHGCTHNRDALVPRRPARRT